MVQEFDPFNPATWVKKTETEIVNPEAEERFAKAYERILAKYQNSQELRDIKNYLQLGKADRAFHKRLKTDEDFRSFIAWLKANEYRTERAIEKLQEHLDSVMCPHCGSVSNKHDVIDIGGTPFDWHKFAEEEEL